MYCTCINFVANTLIKKKIVGKKRKAEKGMEKVLDTFLKHPNETENVLENMKDIGRWNWRWKKGQGNKQDQEHDLRMMK